mmetsp:Transcript_5516/g.12635  ORF Transcript_5516/g.12635 Transcript_5516/m.12635 type:complete len:116 (-) Transcript_5516:1500-1847(-)
MACALSREFSLSRERLEIISIDIDTSSTSSGTFSSTCKRIYATTNPLVSGDPVVLSSLCVVHGSMANALPCHVQWSDGYEHCLGATSEYVQKAFRASRRGDHTVETTQFILVANR